MSEVQHISRTGQFLTTVADLIELSPRMRRIVLRAPELAGRDWPLGCDIAIVLTGGFDGREVRRRYTVRSHWADSVVVDAVLHGHGPGSTWAQQLAAGDEVTFFGPRGELSVSPAPWLVALTDESGLPAIAALAEAAQPAGRQLRVLAEIDNEQEHYPLPDNAQVSWLTRDGRPAGQPDILTTALDLLTPSAGGGYAYVLGESRAVVALREALGRFGLSRSDVHAKGYWNLNSRPTR